MPRNSDSPRHGIEIRRWIFPAMVVTPILLALATATSAVAQLPEPRSAEETTPAAASSGSVQG